MGTNMQKSNAVLRKIGVAVLVFILVLGGALVRKEYESEISNAQLRVHTSAHVVATQFSWIFEASGQALRRIETALDTANLHTSNSVIIDINEAVRDLPRGYQYSVYDDMGQLIYSSIANAESITVEDRRYFEQLRGGENVVLSPMLKERLSGEQVFILARRLDNAGEFAGIASIAIPIATLSDLADSLGFTDGSTISLIRTDGILIARTPPMESMDLKDSQVFTALQSSPDGFYESVSPADGVSRLVGYWKLENWPVVAIAGINREAATAGFWHQMAIWAVIGVPMLIGIALGSMKLLRMLHLDEQRQEALARANQQNEFLLREIHHRVKNNLQTVMSLIRLQKLPGGKDNGLIGRIGAMVSVHEEMYKSDQLESVAVGPYLERLTADIAKGYGKEIRITLDIASVNLPGDRAMQLGLLVNELVSNAFKHAFSKQETGELQVRLIKSDAENLMLVVADDGPGFDTGKVKKNMGSKLVEAFVSQLGGVCTFHMDNGTRVEVVFPSQYGQTGSSEGY